MEPICRSETHSLQPGTSAWSGFASARVLELLDQADGRPAAPRFVRHHGYSKAPMGSLASRIRFSVGPPPFGWRVYHQPVHWMPLTGEGVVACAHTRKARLDELLVG